MAEYTVRETNQERKRVRVLANRVTEGYLLPLFSLGYFRDRGKEEAGHRYGIEEGLIWADR
jgi:hypothetical protein